MIDAHSWTPSETLFAFAGWLTTRPAPLHLGSNFAVPPAVEAVKEFCDAYGFEPPREGWDQAIRPVPETT